MSGTARGDGTALSQAMPPFLPKCPSGLSTCAVLRRTCVSPRWACVCVSDEGGGCVWVKDVLFVFASKVGVCTGGKSFLPICMGASASLRGMTVVRACMCSRSLLPLY